jgi:predicted acetyltransferase
MDLKLEGQITLLISLTTEDLEDQMVDPKRTGKRYDLVGALESPDEHMRKILGIKLAKMEEVPEMAMYSTYFLIVAKETKVILGTIGFKGAPDETGTIEVGYGIQEAYRCMGYMTDALKTFTAFGLSLPGVQKVIACTSKKNTASCRVLEKAGYKRIYEAEDLYVWRYVQS